MSDFERKLRKYLQSPKYLFFGKPLLEDGLKGVAGQTQCTFMNIILHNEN